MRWLQNSNKGWGGRSRGKSDAPGQESVRLSIWPLTYSILWVREDCENELMKIKIIILVDNTGGRTSK